MKRRSLFKGPRQSLSESCHNLLRSAVDKLAQAQCFDGKARWSRDQVSASRVVGKRSTAKAEAALFITLLCIFSPL